MKPFHVALAIIALFLLAATSINGVGKELMATVSASVARVGGF